LTLYFLKTGRCTTGKLNSDILVLHLPGLFVFLFRVFRVFRGLSPIFIDSTLSGFPWLLIPAQPRGSFTPLRSEVILVLFSGIVPGNRPVVRRGGDWSGVSASERPSRTVRAENIDLSH
jgi:hypothetical protein